VEGRKGHVAAVGEEQEGKDDGRKEKDRFHVM